MFLSKKLSLFKKKKKNTLFKLPTFFILQLLMYFNDGRLASLDKYHVHFATKKRDVQGFEEKTLRLGTEQAASNLLSLMFLNQNLEVTPQILVG